MSLSSGFDAVVNRIAGRLEAKGHENLESAVQVLAVVLSSFSGKEYLPPDTVLTAVNRTLSLAYDQHSAGRATSKSVLRLLTVIREHITGSLPEDVVVLLAALRTGLGLWIEDKMEIMTVDDFNSVIIPLYCDTLQVLERLPLSSATLQNIESFLASGFSRIPTPAIAPFAFEKFWRATYYGQTQFYEDLPPSIKFCLLCFVAAYGGDLAFGLSVSTESQTQDSLILLTTVGANSMIHVSSNHGVDQLVDEDNIRGEHDESIPSVADMTFILLSDHYTREHPALRRLQHYASGNVISSPDEELADHQQLPSKSILRYLPESPIPEAECPLGQGECGENTRG
ncbi:hypothetical protein ID866_4831 [Astraeus odoratus]|nr:hypothetical protein ID866_4831 [Astraeus odoratus]